MNNWKDIILSLEGENTLQVNSVSSSRGEKGDAPEHTWDGTSLAFSNPDGSIGNYVDLKGEKGDRGVQGESTAAANRYANEAKESVAVVDIYKAEVFAARDATFDYKNSAENAATLSESARDDSISARDDSANYAADSLESGNNSASSAILASTHAENALISETNAGNFASNALISENNAKISEDNAKISETNASYSESNASQSATNANASAYASSQHEDNAKVSEDNAKASETAANEAEQSAIEAAASAAASAAIAAAEASAWAVGTTYGAGEVVYGSDYITYRSKSADNVGHDPVSDTTETYWAQTLGANISQTPGALKVPQANSSGKIEMGWLPLKTNLENLGAVGFRWDPRADTYQTFNLSSLTDCHLNMKRCIMDNTGTKAYNLGATDSTKQEDGVTDATLDGSIGQIMTEIPKTYYALFTDNYGYVNLFTSDTPLPEMSLHPAFNWGGTIKDNVYIGSLEACLYQSTKYGSAYPSAATAPASALTRTQFRTNMADGVFGQWYWNQYDLLRLLMYSEFGTFRVQEQLEGHTEDSSDKANVTPVGATLSLGNASGTINNGSLNTANSYRGIENPFGNIWKWVDGIIVYDWVPYICDDQADIAALGTTPPSDYHPVLDQHGNIVELPHSSNYQKRLWDGTLLPATIGGSGSSYISDYFSQASGARVVLVGGALTYARQAGIGYLTANYAASRAYWYIGSRSAVIA